MFRRTLFVLTLFALASVPVLVQSPEAKQMPVDTKLTQGFLKDDQSNAGDLAYHEVIGLMTLAERGENFGYYESMIQAKAKKGGGNNKNEFARMLVELRNLSLRVKATETLEARIKALEVGQTTQK